MPEEIVCPDCGDRHIHVSESDDSDKAAEAVTSAEVRIAEIQAERDVRLAKIAAGIARDEAESDAKSDTARAEGEAAGLREALAPEPEPEPEPELPAVVVASDDDAQDDELEPPDAAPAPAPAARRSGLGMW